VGAGVAPYATTGAYAGEQSGRTTGRLGSTVLRLRAMPSNSDGTVSGCSIANLPLPQATATGPRHYQ
jgi:hypothetical protein